MFNLPVTFGLQFLHLKCRPQAAGSRASRRRMVSEGQGEDPPPPSPDVGFVYGGKQTSSGSKSFSKGKTNPCRAQRWPSTKLLPSVRGLNKITLGPSSLEHAVPGTRVSPNLNCVPLSPRKPKRRPGSLWHMHRTQPVFTGQKDVYRAKEFTTGHSPGHGGAVRRGAAPQESDSNSFSVHQHPTRSWKSQQYKSSLRFFCQNKEH